MVLSGWLVVPQMLEAGGVRVREVEWHVGVSIINGVAFSSFQKLLNVVFHDWALGMSSVLSSGGLSLDAVAESEDVFESGVLKSVWVYIDHTSGVSDTGFDKFGMWFGSWVDIAVAEWLLNNLVGVNILEGGNLFSKSILVNLEHLPSEHNINASLVALFKSDLISIRELVDFFVRSPELDSSVGSGSSLDLILSQERFVVESVEVVSFTLVWEFWRVADHVSIRVVPSVIVVSADSLFSVNGMDENVFLLRTGIYIGFLYTHHSCL